MASEHAFDPWSEADLVRYLRTYAQLLDETHEPGQHHPVTATDVAAQLNLDEETNRRAQQRLRRLGLLEDDPYPGRLSDGELTSGRVLSNSGLRAAMTGKLNL